MFFLLYYNFLLIYLKSYISNLSILKRKFTFFSNVNNLLIIKILLKFFYINYLFTNKLILKFINKIFYFFIKLFIF